METDVIVIGAGPVGLFTIFQAGMLGMKCHVIDSLDKIGGQCSHLYAEKPIYDIPGFPEILAGKLIENLEAQASPFKPYYHLSQEASKLTILENDKFKITTNLGQEIVAKIIIIAAGSGAFTPNKPLIPNLTAYEEKTVFYSVKSKELFRGKTIVIGGGGDSAVDWAINLAGIAEKIYLVHRREKFRCLDENFNQVCNLVKENKIEIIVPYQFDHLIGEKGILREVVVKDIKGSLRNIYADYLLLFFGLINNLSDLKNWSFNISPHNRIIVDSIYYQTSIPGIYAVGDIAEYEGKLKLILVGFAETAKVLHHAYKRVFNGQELRFQYSTSKGIKNNDN